MGKLFSEFSGLGIVLDINSSFGVSSTGHRFMVQLTSIKNYFRRHLPSGIMILDIWREEAVSSYIPFRSSRWHHIKFETHSSWCSSYFALWYFISLIWDCGSYKRRCLSWEHCSNFHRHEQVKLLQCLNLLFWADFALISPRTRLSNLGSVFCRNCVLSNWTQ